MVPATETVMRGVAFLRLKAILHEPQMTSQGTSRADFFDLTGDEDPTHDTETALSQSLAPTAASQSRFGLFASQNTFRLRSTPTAPRVEENPAPQAADDDSDVEMMAHTPVDEAARQRNVESRRERLLAIGINEGDASGALDDPAGHRRGDSVAEVIVISDGEDNGNNEDLDGGVGDGGGDIFGEERRRRRRWNNWGDDLEERLRHPNAHRSSPDLFDFQFPQHILPTMTPLYPPRITLGGGGITSRNRPLQLLNNNASSSMHRRSVQLDGDRLPGRVHAHLDGLVREQDAEYQNLDLSGRLRNAMGRLGDVFGSLGWGTMGGATAGATANDRWGPGSAGEVGAYRGQENGWRRVMGGGRGRGRGFADAIRFGPAAPPPDEEERPLDLPEAPPWKVSFTHPGKMPHGFTSDFAPVEPELIVLDDSDEEIKTKKGKGKVKRPVLNLDSETGSGQTLMLVCTKCKDPLLLGGETEEDRVFGLLCGHVLDGKCFWKLAKPSETTVPANPPHSQRHAKGKGRAAPKEEKNSTEFDPAYKFTFVMPVEPLNAPATSQNEAYQEDNSPSAAAINSRATTNLRGRGRRGIVPTPNISRRTRGRTRQNALDGVHDELTPDPTRDAGSNVPLLDLSDPFFPSLAMNPLRGGARGGRGSGMGRGGGKTKMRKVPKTRGRLREEVFQWICPVPGCGRDHISVRLEMEGAKWKCDPVKGAVLMFL